MTTPYEPIREDQWQLAFEADKAFTKALRDVQYYVYDQDHNLHDYVLALLSHGFAICQNDPHSSASVTFLHVGGAEDTLTGENFEEIVTRFVNPLAQADDSEPVSEVAE